jgi:hypothetical protein
MSFLIQKQARKTADKIMDRCHREAAMSRKENQHHTKSACQVIHFLYKREHPGVQHIPGALCGWGGYYGNYPKRFTTNRRKVTCERCRERGFFPKES